MKVELFWKCNFHLKSCSQVLFHAISILPRRINRMKSRKPSSMAFEPREGDLIHMKRKSVHMLSMVHGNLKFNLNLIGFKLLDIVTGFYRSIWFNPFSWFRFLDQDLNLTSRRLLTFLSMRSQTPSPMIVTPDRDMHLYSASLVN